jgi:hypothetical protein
MNRAALGLAVGAGYVLGRTKKFKMAVAVGTFVAGRRMNPRALAELVSGQLRNNPQFKEISDQLRGELSGAGKAASSALVERQLDALAGRLHDRTAETRDRLAGVVPDADGSEEDESEDGEEEPAARGTRSDEDREPEKGEAEASDDEDTEESEPSGSRSRARKSTAPAKKAGARKTAAKKTARGAKTAGSAAKTASGARRPKGGGDR